MLTTTDRAPGPVPICADYSIHFNPFIDGVLGAVVILQAYLGQLLETAFHRGFWAGLAQCRFCSSLMLDSHMSVAPVARERKEIPRR